MLSAHYRGEIPQVSFEALMAVQQTSVKEVID
jgi:hypothetical protein